jgi:Uma2 family endonuclease
MGMSALQSRSDWTADKVRALPDDGIRYEVVDGELLVSPSPRLVHQRAVSTLWKILHEFTRTHALGETLMSPADIEFSPRRMVQPDAFVAPLINGRRPREWRELRHLLLVAEVLSPRTARSDRHIKRRLYQEEGVPQYWMVDLDARLIERWRAGDPRGELCVETIEWQPSDHAPTLTMTSMHSLPRYTTTTGRGNERTLGEAL